MLDTIIESPAARDDAAPLQAQGLVRLAQGDAAGAIPLLQRAAALAPPHAGLRRALADAHVALGNYADAADEYAAALLEWPDPEMRAARAMALLRLGEHGLALAEAERAMAGQQGVIPMVALGAALRANGRAPESAALLRTAVANHPAYAPAWLALGTTEAQLGRLGAAEASLRTAIALAPDANSHVALALTLSEAGQLEAAHAACLDACRLAPGDPAVEWTLAWVLILGGDLETGLRHYEARKRHPRFVRAYPNLPGREWRRGDLHNQRLLVRAELGLGDTIQLARYIPLLADRGARVIFQCAPSLAPLLAQLPAHVVPKSAPPPEYDLWVDQMSLPRLFGTTLATIPSPIGFLAADPERVIAWRRRIPSGPGLRIGLAWAGDPAHRNAGRLAIPPEMFAGLARMPGAVPVSLQVGPGAGAAAAALGLNDLGALFADFADTAAVIAALDLVISVDTAVAHLAAAMGKPVWLLLPHAADCRWMIGRVDSPWYSSVSLFRQPAPNDWPGVIAEVTRELSAWSSIQPRESQLVPALATAAATPVTNAPHTKSSAVTATDQPRSVARLVRS